MRDELTAQEIVVGVGPTFDARRWSTAKNPPHERRMASSHARAPLKSGCLSREPRRRANDDVHHSHDVNNSDLTVPIYVRGVEL